MISLQIYKNLQDKIGNGLLLIQTYYIFIVGDFLYSKLFLTAASVHLLLDLFMDSFCI